MAFDFKVHPLTEPSVPLEQSVKSQKKRKVTFMLEGGILDRLEAFMFCGAPQWHRLQTHHLTRPSVGYGSRASQASRIRYAGDAGKTATEVHMRHGQGTSISRPNGLGVIAKLEIMGSFCGAANMKPFEILKLGWR